jgi:hypothetical protein
MTEYRTASIDASFLTRRAFEANGPGALFGSAIALYCRMVRDYGVGQVVYCWEARGAEKGAFRRRISADYKAQRKPPAQEYIDACAELQAYLPLLGAFQAHSPAEADDVAYTISRTWPGPHLLWSADKDWAQFVNDNTHLLKPDCSQRPRGVASDEWRRPGDMLVTPENIVEETGFTADGWFEVLCLGGDRTDGIPGLPRVGEYKRGKNTRSEKLHHACPTLVRDLVDGVECPECGGAATVGSQCVACGPTGRLPDEVTHRDLRALVAATAPEMAQWVEVAISNAAALRLSADLVRPYNVELTVEPPRVGGLDELRTWMAGHGLEAMFEQVARLVPDDDDWGASAWWAVDDTEVPF